MPTNTSIERSDAVALMPEEVSNAILTAVAGSNPILSLARRLPNMSRAQQRLPVLNALATAYFVMGDTGLKQTTSISWANKFIDAEELAVIVPIPSSVIDDADYDIWGQVQPELVKAFQFAIAQAVLFGINIPATWTTNFGGYAGIYAGALATGHVVSLAQRADMYDAMLSESGVFALVEQDGFGITGTLADVSVKGMLRNTRDANGQPIFKTSMQDATRYELDGTPCSFPTDGTMSGQAALSISGEFNQLIYSMRQDITYKLLDQAVIQDNAGNIVYNLAQQDMVAMRAVMRLGFALPNPLTRMNQNAATRFPFAVLVP